MSTQALDKDLVTAALEYHRYPTPGKISVVPTKGLTNQRDLALAYSPGVAAACDAIVDDPAEAAELTSRANLVGVITNGTAVLGLGNIGPLAAKPVMEGKGCLFKKFAGIDVFDIELAENDPDKLIDMIAALEPTLGGVNLEDIKAPECFYIEQKLRERMKIPVFHDDQHGTAIISDRGPAQWRSRSSARTSAEVKVVCSGAGAAAIACLDLMVRLGVKRENVLVCDSKGVIYRGRETDLETNKARYAQQTARARWPTPSTAPTCSLDVGRGRAQAGDGGDDGAAPIILALANPTPGNPARGGAGGAARLSHRDRPFRLSEPGEQRPVLPVHLSRRARRRRDPHHRRDEARLRQRDRRAGAGGAVGRGGDRLRRAEAVVRPGVHHSQALRSAADRPHRAGGRPGGHGLRRGDASDRRLGRLPPRADQLRLSLRPDHEAGVPAAAPRLGPRVIYAEGEDERVLRAHSVVLDERLPVRS